jgi:NTE family protein
MLTKDRIRIILPIPDIEALGSPIVKKKSAEASRRFPLKRLLGFALVASLILIWYSTATVQPYVGEALMPGTDQQSNSGAVPPPNDRSRELLVLLAFSGGGTRASALAYGVLQELAATHIVTGAGRRQLLDEVDAISSVSGGSFTNAYFGLFGDKIFEDFREAMLLRPIQSDLLKAWFLPSNWHDLSSPFYGSSDLAASYYDEHIFKGKTFSDIDRSTSPLIIINASDIGTGERLAFTRQLFNLLCVDHDAFPISRAVAASAGVPGVVSPIAIKNRAGSCGYAYPDWLRAMEHSTSRIMATRIKRSLNYMDTDKRPWLHLVDGGITDNLGLRHYYEFSHLGRGFEKFFEEFTGAQVSAVLIISVNAAVENRLEWASKPETPSERQALQSMSQIRMRHHSSDTLHIVERAYNDWQSHRSQGAAAAHFNFVEVTFSAVKDDRERAYLNKLPTSLELSEEQVDKLIGAGRQLLRESPSFQDFLSRYPSAARSE